MPKRRFIELGGGLPCIIDLDQIVWIDWRKRLIEDIHGNLTSAVEKHLVVFFASGCKELSLNEDLGKELWNAYKLYTEGR